MINKQALVFLQENVKLIVENKWIELWNKWDTSELPIKWSDIMSILLSPDLGYTPDYIMSFMNMLPAKFFADQPSITDIVVPGNIERIGSFAFSNCDNLETVVLEEGVATLLCRFISRSNKLREVTFPKSISRIIGSITDPLIVISYGYPYPITIKMHKQSYLFTDCDMRRITNAPKYKIEPYE